jgi:hypothetical protein
MTTEQRFENFVQELTAISRRHGVAVMSIGGVFILEDSKAMQDITYTSDHTRGDLEFRLSQ